jgi:hypothetical protein
MHKQEQHEAAVNEHVHEPTKRVFFQDPRLEYHVKEQNLQKGENTGTGDGLNDPLSSSYESR